MSKRRGFTLTEIVVVIALTSLVLAMVGGCLYFVSTYSGTLISKSEELTKVQTIETYLRGITNQEGSSKYDNIINSTIDAHGKIELLDPHNDITLESILNTIKNTGLKRIFIYKDERITYEDNVFVKCTLVFQSNNEYTFILGIVDNTTGP